MPNNLPKPNKLIPISEAAKVLGVSIDTVRRWDKSGELHSERPDGKNRYFSIIELENYKLHQPLLISEVAKKLNISVTTLRRLDERGLIKPKRNKAGERVYDKERLEGFLKSDYFLRKKQVREEVAEPDESSHDLTAGVSSPDLVRIDKTKELNYSADISDGSTEGKDLNQNNGFLGKIPALLSAIIIFLLLVAIGVTNITISAAKSIAFDPAPSTISKTDVAKTEKIAVAAAVPVSTEKPKVLLTIKMSNVSERVNIRKKPTAKSERVGNAKDGDTFEAVSVKSGWYEVKLADGSTGFISEIYIQK